MTTLTELRALKEAYKRAEAGKEMLRVALWQTYRNACVIYVEELLAAGGEDAKDAARLNYLERHCVEVRKPSRYGSRAMFFAQEISEEGEDYRNDIRAAIDAAMKQEKGS